MNTNFRSLKKIFTIFQLAAIFILFSAFTIQQNNLEKVPALNILDLGRKVVNTNTFTNNGKPTIILFWATWHAKGKKELDEIAEVYGNWQKESGVKLIAISVDDARTSVKVRNTIEAKDWQYEAYIDEDQSFKRAMNVGEVPHLFVLNANNEIVWQTHGFNPDESVAKLHDVINRVAKGEKPE